MLENDKRCNIFEALHCRRRVLVGLHFSEKKNKFQIEFRSDERNESNKHFKYTAKVSDRKLSKNVQNCTVKRTRASNYMNIRPFL